MFMGLGMPIPDLSNKPGPGRPGWGPTGSYDFQFEVTDAVTIKAQPAATGTFTIKWPDGTEQTTAGSNSIPAPNATAGIVSINKKTDTTYADEFAVVGGQTNVTKVISWGKNPWDNMANAFRDCTNLTELPPASNIFKAGSASLSQFISGCTSLTELDMTGWDLGSGTGTNLYYFAFNCTNLEKIIFKNKDVKLSASTPRPFQGVGTNVSVGCEFDMEGLNFTGTCNDMNTWFITARAKVGSNFSNWRFNQSVTNLSLASLFNQLKFVDTSAVLNISGWTDCNAINLNSMFTGAGGASSSTPIDAVNITGLRTNDTTTMYRMFKSAKMSRIIGLNDLVSNSLTGTGVQQMFNLCDRLILKDPSVTPTENFSNSFGSNWSITSVANMFDRLNEQGSSHNEWSYPPNLTGFNLSGVTDYAGFAIYNRLSNPYNLSSVTFPTSAISLQGSFFGQTFTPTSDFTFDFSNVTINVSNFQQTFDNNQCNRYKFGSNVNFSNNTTFDRTFRYSGMPPILSNGDPSYRQIRVEFPTNANFGSVTTMNNMFEGQYGGYSNEVPFTNCQADNFIRIIYGTAFSNNLTVDLLNSQVTEAPSVVQSKLQELTTGAGGWSITVNSTDATIPFEYTGTLAPNTPITPTNNTGSPFTGTKFSSSNSNIAVNATTGVINTPNGGNTTIRYTLDDGCYTEQAISLVSAEFSYSASAYCQDAATDPIPTVTGTSGGAFSAALKVIPFQMQFEVAPNAEKTITIPNATGSSYTVDWGDGTTTTEGAGNRSHTYNPGGVGTTQNPIVSINATGDTGPLTALRFQFSASDVDLIDIPQWGNTEWTVMSSTFSGCTNTSFTVTATDKPDLSSCTNLEGMFRNCSNLQSINNINNWDVSNITSTSLMFQNTPFNQDISSWNVSNFKNMSSMFQGSSFNQDIDSWNVSEVLNMSNMFRQNYSFNQDLNSWDVSKVTDMNNMFYLAQAFNGNISNWNTGDVERFDGLFRNASAFNQYIGSWNTSSATNMNYMFSGATSFNQDIGGWDVSNVTSFVNTLATNSFNNGGQSSINNWTFSTTSNINFQGLFRYASSFNQPINNWNLSRATNLKEFMVGASSFNQTVTNMISTIQNTMRIDSMFSGSQAQADWSQFPFQYADTSAAYAFQSNPNFTGNVSNWQIPSNVGSMQRMMRSSGITNIDFTDSVVGWAVYIYNNGGVPTGINFSGNAKGFDGTRTSDNTSGQAYTVKYSNWPSAWTNNNAQDAFDYLVNTLNWNI